MIIKDIPKKLIYLEIIYNCFIKFLVVDMHFPSILNYVSDAILLSLLWFVIAEHSSKIRLGHNKGIAIAGVLLLMGTISALVTTDASPALYLWSLRNNFRLFAFFYCCCQILDKEDIKKVFEILLSFLYLNIIVCVYEYFARGVEYDYLGGLFGNGVEGGNGPLNALMITAVTYLIIEFINKNKKLWQLMFGIGGCLFIATVGELKIFYFEIVFLIILVCVFVTKNFRMAVFITAICLVGFVGLTYYAKLYPNRVGFLSLAYIREYSYRATYGTSSEINRLTAIPKIWNNYFEHNIKNGLFGLGMGNGEMSSQYSFLTSKFYSLNGGRLRYDWFSHAFMFVEFGIIGLATYVSFFLCSMLKAFKEKRIYSQNAVITNAFVILMIFYNQALRIESFCYIAAFLAAIPYITERKNNADITYEKGIRRNLAGSAGIV